MVGVNIKHAESRLNNIKGKQTILTYVSFQASVAKQTKTALFWANLGFLTFDVETDRLSRNVGKELPLQHAA
jgi:hypothetical protein